MNDDSARQRLRAIFLRELAARTAALGDGLARARELTATHAHLEHLTRLIQTPHALKGAARSARESDLRDLCAGVERVLRQAVDDATPLSEGALALLEACHASLEDASSRLSAGEPIDRSRIPGLVAALEDEAPTPSLRSTERFRQPVPIGRNGRGAPRILFVDDSETERTTYASLFEGLGYLVRVAGSGREALALLADVGTDVVVTDVHMPEMDGLELAEHLRATPARPAVPVILISGEPNDVDRQRGRTSGAVAYFSKGDLGSLLGLLRELAT